MDKDKLDKIKLISEIFASIATVLLLSIITWQACLANKALHLQSRSLDMQTRSLDMQTRSLDAQTRSLDAQIWQSIGQQMYEINKLSFEHPYLYPYFYEKKPIHPNDKFCPEAILMADIFLDFIDGFEDDYVRKLAGMEEGGAYWIAWENYFVDQFRLSPILCNRYKEVESWYTKDGLLNEPPRRRDGGVSRKTLHARSNLKQF